MSSPSFDSKVDCASSLVCDALVPLVSHRPTRRTHFRLTPFDLGIPALFTSLLVALTPYLSLPPDTEKPFRHLVHTEMAESNIAPGLGRLAEEVRKEGIRVGSCESSLVFQFRSTETKRLTSIFYPFLDPALQKGVTISLIGKNQERLKELEQRVRRVQTFRPF